MQKGFPLILIVLAVAIGGYFVYQQQIKSTPVTPLDQTTTQDETANWKTYTVSNQFEFKYPIAQYSVESGPTNIDYVYPGQLVIKPNDSTVSAGSNIYILTISLIINKKHLTLQNVDSLLGVDNSKNQFPSKTATIGGIQAVRYDDIPGQVDSTEIYVIKQDKNYTDGIIYNFTLRTLNGAKASMENEAIIQNILSTFKFLDQDTADTTNWKTYTNTEAKVSFQYPLDWTVKEENPDSESTRISIRGKQGEILLDYGSGFGGGCPAGYEDFKVGNAQTQACHELMADGSEEWSLSNMKNGKADFNDIDYSGFITVNTPYKDNRDLVLKILSTFKFQ